MALPIILRKQMATAVQLGVPDPVASSERPETARPTKERLALAEKLLRDGAPIGWVAEETGLSRFLVQVIANAVTVNWKYNVRSDPDQSPCHMDDDEIARVREMLHDKMSYADIAAELGVDRKTVKWQARQLRKNAENQELYLSPS